MDDDRRKGLIEVVEMVWSGKIDIENGRNGIEVMEMVFVGIDGI